MPTLVQYAKLRFDFEILDECSAGIVLTGAEVKSCRKGQAKLVGSYVSIVGGEAWLKKAEINPYQMNNQRGYQPVHDRRLLLKKSELQYLVGKMSQPGLTLLVESLYTKGGLIKAKLVLVRGRKKTDKRALVRRREVDKRIARALRQ